MNYDFVNNTRSPSLDVDVEFYSKFIIDGGNTIIHITHSLLKGGYFRLN